jgi:hypothetical protein
MIQLVALTPLNKGTTITAASTDNVSVYTMYLVTSTLHSAQQQAALSTKLACLSQVQLNLLQDSLSLVHAVLSSQPAHKRSIRQLPVMLQIKHSS